MFIASDEIVCYPPPNMISTLQTDLFISSDERVLCWDEHFWCWRRTCFTLEMNTLALETNAFELQPHTASYQRLPSRIYVEKFAIVTATYLRNGRYYVEELQKVSTCV